MKRFVFAVCLATLSLGAFGQAKMHPVRIPVRHADPWMIKAMIEGIPIRNPELSTIIGFGGLGGAVGAAAGAAGATNSLLKDGVLVVNPTDNSLWWMPKGNQ